MTDNQPKNPTEPGPSEPGSQLGSEWNRDQESQVREREDGTNQNPSSLPDGSPMQDDENGEGTTTGPGTGTGY